MTPSTFEGARLVLKKELCCSLREPAAWGAMFMFALTTLACVSLSLSGMTVEPKLLAALLWVILFFASMAGADRGFGDEDLARTLPTLQLYGAAQAVLFGKMLYTGVLLLGLAAFTVPLYLIFMDVTLVSPGIFLLTLLAGLWGVAVAGTLLGALSAGARVHNGLCTVLMLPIILPVFLPAIALTAAAFGGGTAVVSYLGGMVLYDLVLSVGASILFDYLWYDD